MHQFDLITYAALFFCPISHTRSEIKNKIHIVDFHKIKIFLKKIS